MQGGAGSYRIYSAFGASCAAASTLSCSMISYISRATSLVRGSTSESTFTLMKVYRVAYGDFVIIMFA